MNWINRFNKFLRNVRSEIRKVSWPTQSEVITMTILIIIMVVLLSGYIGGVDIVYQRIIKQFLSL
ncbi:preprotein translocase subunit SecE [Candidatus Bipolaricaulota bacterium]|nr:preprotein translocase subunit SecE [Candidatus Bipolaricaulota bacterium]